MKYMELEVNEIEEELERQKAQMYINYLANIFSQPLHEKPSKKYTDAKKEFEQMLIPEQAKEQSKVQYVWDFDSTQYLQEGGEQ